MISVVQAASVTQRCGAVAVAGARFLSTASSSGSSSSTTTSQPSSPPPGPSAKDADKFKVLVIGGGTGGLVASNQIYNRFRAAGKTLGDGDVALVDGAEWHHYQPGWTLVGAGLKDKHTLRRPLTSLIPPHLTHIPSYVKSFDPAANSITTASGRTLTYDVLIVAAGLKINWSAIQGLPKALADSNSGVSSIYAYETCDKVWRDIDALRNGKAVFTQPAGVIKCAGAPQKIMWMAWDRYRTTNRSDTVSVSFYTGTPSMFSVKKYSDALNALRIARGVEGLFQHNLTSIDVSNRTAKFQKTTPPPSNSNSTDAKPTTEEVEVPYDVLHVTPPMGPLDVIKNSQLADGAGWVDVHQATLQHKKYSNVFAIGDCSSLPTSKTAAAITAQGPILTENVFNWMEKGNLGEDGGEKYDGYTSCPLLTGYGQLMLAEFKYGLEPKESFANYLGDQATPRRLYYHLKKDFFPWVYYDRMVKGEWFGPHGIRRPIKT